MTYSHVWRDWFIDVPRLVYMCDMYQRKNKISQRLATTWPTHSRRSLWGVPWLNHMCDSFKCVICVSGETKLVNVGLLYSLLILGDHSDMTQSYVMWLIHVCAVTHSHVWHVAAERWSSSTLDYNTAYSFQASMVAWLSHMWCDSFMCVPWLIHIFDIWQWRDEVTQRWATTRPTHSRRA